MSRKLLYQAQEVCIHATTDRTLFNMMAWAGFAIGAVFSLMSASMAYEDPLRRAQMETTGGTYTPQKVGAVFREMGRGMWSSGKGFGKVGALFAGIECVIEGVSVCITLLLRF